MLLLHKFFFLVLDALSLLICFHFFWFIRFESWTDISNFFFGELLIIVIIALNFFYVFNLYNVNCYQKIKKIIRDILLSLLATVLSSVFAIYFITPKFFNSFFPNKMYFLVILGAFVICLVNRVLYLLVRKKFKIYTNYLVLGNKKELDVIDQNKNEFNFFNIIAKAYKDPSIESLIKKPWDSILIGKDIVGNKFILSKLLAEKNPSSKIDTILNFVEIYCKKTPFELIRSEDFFTYNYRLLYSSFNIRIKRILDLNLSIIFIILLSPLALLIALLIKLSTRESIIYKDKRYGKNKKEFNLYKFRTMYNMHEENLSKKLWAGHKKITKIGKFLRPLRLDEIPQFINVFKGDMSFIGPRPVQVKIYNYLESKALLYNTRSLIKPGITGWAQVNYFYANSQEKELVKLQYDLFYIRNFSLLLDLLIILKTIRVIIFRIGQ